MICDTVSSLESTDFMKGDLTINFSSVTGFSETPFQVGAWGKASFVRAFRGILVERLTAKQACKCLAWEQAESSIMKLHMCLWPRLMTF